MDPSFLMSKAPIAETWPLNHVAGNRGAAVLWMRAGGPGVDAVVGHGSGMSDVGGGGVSLEESTVTDQSGGARSRRRRAECGAPGAAGSEDESSRVVSTGSVNELKTPETKQAKQLKTSHSRDENGESKPETAASSCAIKLVDQVPQPSEDPKQDYIHVRARRGQATDSHSLAERARREKISQRMKIIQDLVPGCDKVIGKALVLDEIINYIQSLQRQIEFLSMKLEAISSQRHPAGESFLAKNHGIHAFGSPALSFTSQPIRDCIQGTAQEWLHMQVGGGI